MKTIEIAADWSRSLFKGFWEWLSRSWRRNAALGLILASAGLPAFGTGFVYLQSEKQTNSSYKWKLPAFEMTIQKEPLLIDWESSLDFTSPRESALSLNHHSVVSNLHVGVQNVPYFATISFGLRYVFAGNSDGLAEGATFENIARLGFEF